MTILDDARDGMDPSVRPQDDLFGHVNGRWLATTEIPSDRPMWGPFVELAERAQEHVREILEELDARREELPDGSSERKIADLYRTFMDAERAEALGASPIADDLSAVDGVDDVAGLSAFLGRFERIGGSGLFGGYVNTDDRDSDRYVVNVVQGGLGLPDESYYREDRFGPIVERYAAHLEAMFSLIGRSAAAEEAAAVLRLERRLAAGHWELAATRDVVKGYNSMRFDELRSLLAPFDLDGYVTGLGGDEHRLAEVIVRQPSFFGHAGEVLEDVAVEDWRAWLRSKVIRGAAPLLSSPFVEEQFDFYGRTLSGTPELRPRWKRAVAFVESAIGEAVAERYVARHFPPAAKAEIDRLVGNLLTAYRRSIEQLDWMGPTTKSRAFDKLATFRPKVGYPERFRDYSGLEVVAGDLVGSAQRAAAFESDRQLAKLGGPVDRDEWHMLPQTVNAYYNPGVNEICFPAAILQRPFFDPDADPAENYGGIGAVIGHEIGHGFDDQGSQYDEHGNLDEWWDDDDRARFRQRADALIAQYAAFEPRNLPGERVNGDLTVGENIGDLGGITIAHLAHEISREGTAVAVDDDDDSASVRLFLNWAHVWRVKVRRQLEQQLLTVDVHAPPEFRANVVRNLDEFHAAFGTKPGDGLWLDEDERVRIW